MNLLTKLLALGILLSGSSLGQETKTYPDGTKYQTPSFTKAGPDSNLLDDQFIIGTGSFAPDGGLLLPREKVYEHINKSTPISTNNQTNYNNQSNSSGQKRQETITDPDSTKYQTPAFTQAGPDSNLLDDQFINGTGSFAPDGGLLLPREKVYEHIHESTPISTNNQTNYNNQSNSSSQKNITVVPRKQMTINLANMTFLVNPLPEYDMTERILWVNFKPYSIVQLVNNTKTPDMWATLNQTGIQQPYQFTSYWTLDAWPGNGTVIDQPGLICQPKFCFRTAPYDEDQIVIRTPKGAAIVMPLDASNAYNSEDLVFWVGAKVYGLVAGVSESFADGISTYVSDVKVCRSNGQCITNISVSNSSKDSFCLQSGKACFTGKPDTTKWQYIEILGQAWQAVNSSYAKVYKNEDVVVLYEGVNVWELGYPQPNYTGPVVYSPNGQTYYICSNGVCLACISNDPFSRCSYMNMTAGNTTYYGYPIDNTKGEITKVDGVTYLLEQKSISEVLNTDETVLWTGGNPYSVVYPMYDVNYTSISFDFNSSSGTYDIICANQTCMKDLERISIYETDNYTNVYCNTYDMCYTYETDNVYFYLSKFYSIVDIDNITYLTVKNTFSAGWTSPNIVFWKDYDSYTVLDVLPQDNSYSTVKIPLSKLITCDGYQSCFNNYQRILNTTEGEECIYGQCYAKQNFTRQEKAVCFRNSTGISSCSLLYPLDNKTANNQSQPHVIWINQTGYKPVNLFYAPEIADINVTASQVVQCFAGDGCYRNWTQSRSNSSTGLPPNYKNICFGQGLCWTAEKYANYTSVQLTKMSVVASSLDRSNLSSNLIAQERIRQNFRDFFTYAIKGVKSNPIEAGICSSNCQDSSNCCSNIIATDKKTSMITFDNVCMLKSVVKSWSDLTLDDVAYTMSCGADQNSVSGAKILSETVGIVLTVSVLFYTSLY